jgi:hypothetical protein
MDTAEARNIARAYLDRYRRKPYDELRQLIGSSPTDEVTGARGTKYQVELGFFWDDPGKPNDVIRVRVAVDDGGVRVFMPLCEDFLIAPNGSFIDDDAA